MNILNQSINKLIYLEKAFIISRDVLLKCPKKTLKNQLIYHQIQYSHYGIIAFLYAFIETDILKSLMKEIKEEESSFFKTPESFEITSNPLIFSIDEDENNFSDTQKEELTLNKINIIKENYNQIFRKWFPLVEFHKRNYFEKLDFIVVSELIKEKQKPLKAVRDKSIAHWDDKKKQPAYHFEDIEKILTFLKELLSDLVYLKYLSNQSVTISALDDKGELSSQLLYEIIVEGKVM